MKINVKIDPEAFNEVYYPYLNCDKRNQIFFGGSSSGKSRFIAQRTILDLVRGGRNYLLVRNTADTIRSSMFKELKQVISDWGAERAFKINKSEMTITCVNGYQALSKGLDNVEKIKSVVPEKGVITDIWTEEATETSKEDRKQLTKRLRGLSKHKKRITMSFNPILRSHWIYKDFFDGLWSDDDCLFESDDTIILKTTYKDNKFLEADDILELEKETDPYWRDVYTLGKWGTLGDVIFQNWSVQSNMYQEHFDNYRNGIDFGYGADPYAFNRSHYDKKRGIIYILEERHKHKMTNQMIATDVSPIIGDEVVVCDSAEPKSIQELKTAGLNAIGAVKGKDSVNFGIQWLQQQKIIIDRKCQHTVNEFETYQWQKDKNGESLPVPVKKNDHHVDGMRYAYERDMLDQSVFSQSDLQQCQM